MIKFPNSETSRIITHLSLKPKSKQVNKRPEAKNKTQGHNFKLTNRSFSSQLKALKTQASSRFKKHQNMVQTNKNILSRAVISTPPVSNIKSLNCLRNKYTDFSPKSLDQIIPKTAKYEQSTTIGGAEGLQYLLRKQSMKKPRNLLSYNILSLEKKYNFSRFQLHNLYSVFHTLLRDSKQSVQKFKRNFQVIFSMNKASVRPQMLERIFFQQKEVDFQNFLAMYARIEYNIYQQNIIDYVDILFEGLYDKEHIRFQDIVRLLRNRITDQEANDLAKIVYQSLDRYEQKTVSLSEIEDLCSSSQVFAKKMYRLYTQQCKCQ